LCTMHAEDVETAIKRLTQPPMNIPPSIIPLMNCAIVVKHVRTPIFLDTGKRLSSRKFISIKEIRSADSTNDVISWNPSSDIFQENMSSSYLLQKIAKDLDVPVQRLLDELEHRKRVLVEMMEHNVRNYRDVNNVLNKYYHNPHIMPEDLAKKSGW